MPTVPTPPPAGPPAASRRGIASGRTPRRRLLVDRAARHIVAAGGFLIIASILGILIFIVAEVAPLLLPARVAVDRAFAVPGSALGLVVDEYRELGAALGTTGTLDRKSVV